MRVLAAAPLALLLVRASFAGTLALPAPYRPDAVDSLRVEAIESLSRGDLAAAMAAQRAVLRARPGDGCALREAARTLRDRLPADSLDRLMRARRPVVLGDVALDPASAEFLRGYLDKLACRYASAREHFDAALKSRPGWGWARLYRASMGLALAAPYAPIEADFTAALADPASAPAAVDLVMWVASRGGPARFDRPRSECIAWLRGVPWARDDVAAEEVRAALASRSSVELPFLEDAWRTGRRWPGYGTYLRDILPFLATRLAKPAEGLRFLEAREAEDSVPWGWRTGRVWILRGLLRTAEAESLARTLPASLDDALAVRLDLALDGDRPISELRTLADSLEAAGFSDFGMGALRRFCDATRDSVRRKRVETTCARHAVATLVGERFECLLGENLDAATALLDSLTRAGSSDLKLPVHRAQLLEARGDTTSLAALPALPPEDAGWLADGLTAAIRTSGRSDRLARVWAWADARWTPGYFERLSRCSSAFEFQRTDEILRQSTELGRNGPGEPPSVVFPVSIAGEAGRTEASQASARAALDSPVRSPRMFSTLALTVARQGALGLADSLMARALALGGARRDVRRDRAALLILKDDRTGARATVDGLLAEFPGDEAALNLRRTLDARGVRASDVAAAAPTQRFEGMAELYPSAAIRALSAQADTVRTQSLVLLLWRDDLAADRADRLGIRVHLAMRVMNADGANEARTYQIGYAAADTPPTLLRARVLQPDGQTIDVPPTDIVHASAKDSDTDASDDRALVVPFPGLRPGSIVEVAWEREIGSTISTGFSLTRDLLVGVPVVERVVEIKTREGSEVHVHASPAAAPPAVRREGSYVYRSWRLSNARGLAPLPYAPPDWERRPWVGVTSFPTWGAAMQSYVPAFWARTESGAELRRTALARTKSARGAREKLDALLAWTADRLHYTSIELGVGQLVPSPADDVLRRGHGDCKDMAALLVSMLAACGVDAQPVLLSSDEQNPVLDEFPLTTAFTHMIVMARDGADTLYADPTLLRAGLAPLPAGVAGCRGLTFDRAGDTRLVTLPPAPVEQGAHVTFDLTPESRQSARFDIRARYRGQFAGLAGDALTRPDSADATSGVRRILGYGLWETCLLTSWKLEERTPGRTLASAVFRDTAWSTTERQVTARWGNEVADLFTDYPDTAGRREEVCFEHPFTDTFVVRLHDGGGWHVSADLADAHVRGPGYEGTLHVTARADGVELTEVFQLSARRMKPEAYRAFYRDWMFFRAFARQKLVFRRPPEAAQLAQLRDYARRHPEDVSFAMQAVSGLLGNDAGGSGPEGAQYRAAARELLQPMLVSADPTTRAIALMLSCPIEAADGRFRRADSLATEAYALQPSHPVTLPALLACKLVLSEKAAAAEIMQKNLGSNPATLTPLQLMRLLLELGRTEEARAAEERYYLLTSNPDTGEVVAQQFWAAASLDDLAGAKALLARLRHYFKPEDLGSAEASVAEIEGDYEHVLEVRQRVWDEDPLAAGNANNLAWSLALVGRDLDRAEQLARLAVCSSAEPAASRNTLAAVLLRRGKTAEAEALARELSRDERPDMAGINHYLLGLCEHARGDRAAAQARWTTAKSERYPASVRRLAGESLARAARGEDPAGALFDRKPARP